MLIFAFCCFLCSLNTSSTSSTYSSKPRACKAEMTCSPAIVFLFSFSQMSLASEAIKWINSTNHKTRSGQRQSHFDKDLSAYQRIHRWVDRVYLWHRRDQWASFRWSTFAQLLFYGAAYSQCKVSTLNFRRKYPLARKVRHLASLIVRCHSFLASQKRTSSWKKEGREKIFMRGPAVLPPLKDGATCLCIFPTSTEEGVLDVISIL